MNRKKLANELIEKKLADQGFVAWGKLTDLNSIIGGIEGANSSRYAIAKAGEEIVFVPVERGKLLIKNMYAFNSSKIKGLRLTGFRHNKLKMTTIDGHEKIYHITSGKRAVKKIIESLGL